MKSASSLHSCTHIQGLGSHCCIAPQRCSPWPQPCAITALHMKEICACLQLEQQAEQARLAAELARRAQDKQRLVEFQAARAGARQQEEEQAAAAQEAVLQEACSPSLHEAALQMADDVLKLLQAQMPMAQTVLHCQASC